MNFCTSSPVRLAGALPASAILIACYAHTAPGLSHRPSLRSKPVCVDNCGRSRHPLPTHPNRSGALTSPRSTQTADPCPTLSIPCGNWIKDNPVPSDQTRWARSFSMLSERNRYLLWQQLDSAAKAPKTHLKRSMATILPPA